MQPGFFIIILVLPSLAFFGKASSERVVGVCPDLGVAGGLFDSSTDEQVF